MSKIEEVLSNFRNDFNCAQSVFGAFAPHYGLDLNKALKIASGFGGGMGRSGRTCGAVTGAYMVIGLKTGMGTDKDNEAKDKTYQIVNDFSNRFQEINGSMMCREILGCDITTPEGRAYFDKNELLEKKCFQCVKSAAELLESIL
ncbi:MAG: C-GCAxxG-C-C family protein [Promethearchaeota archaeon]|jgi:C_GCAxxG_C_C family probable redox protein